MIDENLLTSAKFTFCSALQWLCITQHFEIVWPNCIILGIVDVQLFKDELAEDELPAAAMLFQFTDY